MAYKKIKGIIHYLIICSSDGEYWFPKWHVEKNETEYETAIRELKEEANIEVQFIDGFRRQIEYKLPNKEDVIKQAVYFIEKCITNDIKYQEAEVSEAMFLPFEKAIELLSFNTSKNILKEANEFIHSTILPR